MESNSCVAPLNNLHHLRRAHETLAHHAKSFSWAAKLFPRQAAADVAILYAFCRTVDDIADCQTAKGAQHQLASIRSDLDAATSSLPDVHAFIDLARRNRIHPRIPQLFVETIMSDTGKVRIDSWDDLIRFAYGVASTVGLMMCAVMGVRDLAALPFAVDLGIAMQLTNIARDIVEDAKRDRLYLPVELLGDSIEPARIIAGDSDLRRRVADARKQLLRSADRYYRSADKGMRYIPLRARLAVMTAARLYEAIGPYTEVQSTWDSRAFVGVSEKIMRTIGAVSSILFNPAYWQTGRHPAHDWTLHRPLTGLPGTNRDS